MFLSLYVTGPAKIGHVGTKYTMPLSKPYLNTELDCLLSVTCFT